MWWRWRRLLYYGCFTFLFLRCCLLYEYLFNFGVPPVNLHTDWILCTIAKHQLSYIAFSMPLKKKLFFVIVKSIFPKWISYVFFPIPFVWFGFGRFAFIWFVHCAMFRSNKWNFCLAVKYAPFHAIYQTCSGTNRGKPLLQKKTERKEK